MTTKNNKTTAAGITSAAGSLVVGAGLLLTLATQMGLDLTRGERMVIFWAVAFGVFASVGGKLILGIVAKDK